MDDKFLSPCDPKKYEESIYSLWEESGLFNPDICIKKGFTKKDASVFSVIMPPPNVTGVLHIGHVLEQGLMDVKVRYFRMKGHRSILIPGTDHAAIATQARVEADLVKGGIKNPRKELGKEKLLKKIKEYADESQGTIINQIKKLGTSCDWSRLAYTLDDTRSNYVREVFKKMYDDGLIYRAYRPVNWSTRGQSTCSDDELERKTQDAKLYTFKYSADFPIPIATTRPETKLGDTAVAVHPDDKRYSKYIDKEFTVDVRAAKPLIIKIIADKRINPEFGTGAVGVTPAHSMLDFELKEDHNLNLIAVIDRYGKMTKEAGSDYEGLKIKEAREKFILWLKENNLLIEEVDIENELPVSDRYKDIVEVLPMLQWFVNVQKKIPNINKTLNELQKEAVDDSKDRKEKVVINPSGSKNAYFEWVNNPRNWCISRQIWWGHQIPVWYKGEKTYCGVVAPSESGWEQDPDTLDTWFSSGLWSFSVFSKDEQKIYHPTSWIQMGYELIFLWMGRMILMSSYALGEIPFKKVYIHGLVRDEKGQKYSKSLRNALNPLEVIDKYGADALRLALLSVVTPRNDIAFSMEKVKYEKHFCNKLWNITRFVLQETEDLTDLSDNKTCSQADKDIINRACDVRDTIGEHLEKDQIHLAVELLHEYVWHEFADKVIEESKLVLQSDKKDVIEGRKWALKETLNIILTMSHPFLPFISEEIWRTMNNSMLMVRGWNTENRL